MPIYEYVCKSCEFQKDVLQKLSDDPLTECPQCGENSFNKKISAAGFRLSGTGWYETDFKTGKKKNLVDKVGSGNKDASKASDNAGTGN